MTLQIVQDCQSAVGCIKGVLVSTYCIVMIAMISKIIYRMHKFISEKWSFELIPLSSTICQSVLQLILNLFIMDTKLLISALCFQTLTFGIISTSCSQLCLRIKYPHQQLTAKKYTLLAFCCAQLISVVMLILTLANVFPEDCNDWFSVAYLFPMIVMLCYTFASVAFGSTLISIMKTKDKKDNIQSNQIIQQNSLTSGEDSIKNNINGYSSSNEDSSNSNFHSTNKFQKVEGGTDQIQQETSEDEYDIQESGQITQLKKQLRLIEFLFLITIAFQLGSDAVRTYLMDQHIKCEGSNQFQAQDDWGQLFLIFYQFIQITPCLIAPYVFYYVPYKEDQGGQNINLHSSFADFNEEDNDDDENEEENQLKQELIKEDEENNNQRKSSVRANSKQKVTRKSSKALFSVLNKKEPTQAPKKPQTLAVSPLVYQQSHQIKIQNINLDVDPTKSQNSNSNKDKNSRNGTKKKGGQSNNQRNKNKKEKAENILDSEFNGRRLDDTMEDMGDFIERMSVKVKDVENNQSVPGSIVQNIPFLQDSESNETGTAETNTKQ